MRTGAVGLGALLAASVASALIPVESTLGVRVSDFLTAAMPAAHVDTQTAHAGGASALAANPNVFDIGAGTRIDSVIQAQLSFADASNGSLSAHWSGSLSNPLNSGFSQDY